MTNHTSLLNYLATTFNLQSYLEIGVQNPVNNFDKIVCESKTGVEPTYCKPCEREGMKFMTSDDFFKHYDKAVIETDFEGFQLVFIDGLHTKEQVKKDFDNSLQRLHDNGFIVIHDTLPEKEEYTHVPRDSKIWNGDVWKFAVTLNKYESIDFCTSPFDHGCTVVWKNDMLQYEPNPNINGNNWNTFQKNKKYLLRITTVKSFKDLMNDVQAVQQL